MKKDRFLLVEGNDDCHVIWSLLQHHAHAENFSVVDNGGIDNLLINLPVRLKGSGIVAVGVVVDADLNGAGRWSALRSVLAQAGYTSCPASPAETGTIIEEQGLPKFGAWIMPDNKLSGMLEDFVSYLVPEHDSLWGMVQNVVSDIPPLEKKFSENHAIKAEMHTWLAWQQDPGTPMGLAITKKYLDPESAAAGPFMAWMTALFQS